MTQDQFYHLLDDVEAQGGSHLPGSCKGRMLDYGKQVKPLATHGCKKEFRLQIPYDGEEKVGLTAEQGHLVVVCAEGDRVDLWPRFQED